MAQRKLTDSQLHKLGYPPGAATEQALVLITSHFKGKSVLHKKAMLKRVLENPALYRSHEVFSSLAQILLESPPYKAAKGLSEKSAVYAIYGKAGIAQEAIDQMDLAMRLPVAKAGALMPDAHKGYGLPIGGVLATENVVIPYGVGVDIGCRMCMTLYDIPAAFVQQHTARLSDILMDNTRFGQTVFSTPMDHQVLEDPLFNEIQLLRNLKDKAWKQIGSSGGGNHFVEFGMTEIVQPVEDCDLPEGKYLTVLSHSGSRGFGATIAQHYTKTAMQHTTLPSIARHLAWLDLDEEAGQEYWLAMNLAGAYAKACHDQIHHRLAAALGEQPLVTIENHHNFAWKEEDSDGNEIIVHRKGATPAAAGVLGIIPGSMTAPGFIVRGKGNPTSLNSASHGAGRVMSRSQAKSTLSKKEVAKAVKKAGITLLGSGIDEAPQVYKDIHQVMAQQESLVEVIGTFKPVIVRMCKTRE
jgi:tRNA-splicing ligase RtcB